MNKKLTDTLGLLYDMELNNYLTIKSIDKLKGEIDKLGKPQDVKKEYLGKYSRMPTIIGKASVFGFVFGVLGLIGGLIYGLVVNDTNLFERIFVAPMIAVMIGVPVAVVGAVIGAIVAIPISSKEEEHHKIREKQAEEYYEKRLEQEQSRLEKEKNTKHILVSEQKVLENRLTVGIQRINEFYSSIGIDDAYRNIVAISYMYEYAKLGIATKLEGVDGLYYLIKKEIQAEKLQYTLEDISKKLNTIVDNQAAVYNQLLAMNTKCDSMITETRRTAERVSEANQKLRQIEYNSSIAAYNTKRIETELRYQNYIINNY